MICGFSFSASVLKLILLSLTNAQLVPVVLSCSHLPTIDAFQWPFRFLDCLPSRHAFAVPLSSRFLSPLASSTLYDSPWYSPPSRFPFSFFFLSHESVNTLILTLAHATVRSRTVLILRRPKTISGP